MHVWTNLALTTPENIPIVLRSTTRSPARPPRRHELLDLALERGLVPDSVLRAGSIHGAWARERRESRGGVQAQEERLRSLCNPGNDD
jgi:hypothetical protein